MSPRRPRARRQRRQKQEGIVLLIVLLILMMATGTALLAQRATLGEQRAARNYGEAMWTRSVAEGAAWSAVARLKMRGRIDGSMGVDTRWQDPAQLPTRYGMAGPNMPMAGGMPSTEMVDGVLHDTPGLFPPISFPQGAAGFAGPPRTGLAPYEARAGSARTRNFRYLTLTFGPMCGSAPSATATRSTAADCPQRYVSLGFGETGILNDPTEAQVLGGIPVGRRGMHSKVSIAVGYVDALSPPL